jgi:hypothetical protein
MIDLHDPLWKTFMGGYRVCYDASEHLQKLESSGEDLEVIWDEFWNELHHQGDVDIASYATIPHLVRICVSRNILDWNVFAITATIEDCRVFGKNPPLPEWLENDYQGAIKDLAAFGARKFSDDWPHNLTQPFLAVVAFAKGLPNTGRVLITFSEEEISEVSDAIVG